MPLWIDQPAALQTRLAQHPDRIGLDTEFIRERTYWPRLALVQMAVGDEILLIDPLVPGMATALSPWLSDPHILKIMHSASEDLVAFKHTCGMVPRPLFDTQIAAAMTGYGPGLGYQKLVQAVDGVLVDKGETRSDWLHRPLTPSQLQYAADDVRHLFSLHTTLEARLQALGRRDWLQEDAERLCEGVDRDLGETWPHLALRSAQFLDPPAQHRLLRLLRWRDHQARLSDRPRSWILDNELACTLARTPPADRSALLKLLDRFPKAPRKLADSLLQALTTPLADEHQAPLARATDESRKTVLRQLQQAVAERARALDLPEGLLASRRHLEALLDSPRHWPSPLCGWRRQQLEPALAPWLDNDRNPA